jgi:hypothetical protein
VSVRHETFQNAQALIDPAHLLIVEIIVSMQTFFEFLVVERCFSTRLESDLWKHFIDDLECVRCED